MRADVNYCEATIGAAMIGRRRKADAAVAMWFGATCELRPAQAGWGSVAPTISDGMQILQLNNLRNSMVMAALTTSRESEHHHADRVARCNQRSFSKPGTSIHHSTWHTWDRPTLRPVARREACRPLVLRFRRRLSDTAKQMKRRASSHPRRRVKGVERPDSVIGRRRHDGFPLSLRRFYVPNKYYCHVPAFRCHQSATIFYPSIYLLPVSRV
jgi:hypothetical protein